MSVMISIDRDKYIEMTSLLNECREVIKKEEKKNEVLKKMIFILTRKEFQLTDEARKEIEKIFK